MRKTILVGDRFSELTVIEDAGYSGQPGSGNRRRQWRCRCDCGNETVVKGKYLSNGDTKSCGCRQIRAVTARNTNHGLSGSPAYVSWAQMIQRCNNPNLPHYDRYGGRGVQVCERWLSFDAFFEDMGQRPDGTSLYRKDVNGNYEPGNCLWMGDFTQTRNRRAPHNSPFGIRGVTYHPDQKTYHVKIGANRRQVHLACTTDFFEACCIRKSAENRLWANAYPFVV